MVYNKLQNSGNDCDYTKYLKETLRKKSLSFVDPSKYSESYKNYIAPGSVLTDGQKEYLLLYRGTSKEWLVKDENKEYIDHRGFISFTTDINTAKIYMRNNIDMGLTPIIMSSVIPIEENIDFDTTVHIPSLSKMFTGNSTYVWSEFATPYVLPKRYILGYWDLKKNSCFDNDDFDLLNGIWKKEERRLLTGTLSRYFLYKKPEDRKIIDEQYPHIEEQWKKLMEERYMPIQNYFNNLLYRS